MYDTFHAHIEEKIRGPRCRSAKTCSCTCICPRTTARRRVPAGRLGNDVRRARGDRLRRLGRDRGVRRLATRACGATKIWRRMVRERGSSSPAIGAAVRSAAQPPSSAHGAQRLDSAVAGQGKGARLAVSTSWRRSRMAYVLAGVFADRRSQASANYDTNQRAAGRGDEDPPAA